MIKSSRLVAPKAMLSFIAVFTAISSHFADWSASHVFNPNWPPHAKFHNGQTLALAIAACLFCLWFTWRRGGETRTNAIAAISFASLYWITQATAILYPGAAFFDPHVDAPRFYLFGLPVQVVIEIVALLLISLAARLLLWPSDRSDT